MQNAPVMTLRQVVVGLSRKDGNGNGSFTRCQRFLGGSLDLGAEVYFKYINLECNDWLGFYQYIYKKNK